MAASHRTRWLARAQILGWALCAVVAPHPVLAEDPSKPRPGGGAEKSGEETNCVATRVEARSNGLAFDHWVHLTSACKKTTMTCTVKTDVNPDPTTVDLAPGEETRVKMFANSPAREFKADVSCKPHA